MNAMTICGGMPRRRLFLSSSLRLIQLFYTIILFRVDQVWCKKTMIRKDGHPLSRNILVANESKRRLDIFWINPETRKLGESNSPKGGLVYGGDVYIDSYSGHSFEVQEIPGLKSGKCVKKLCQKAYFTVTHQEEQVFTVHPDFTVTYEDQKIKSAKNAKDTLKGCVRNESLPIQDQLEQLSTCMEQKLGSAMQQTSNEIEFQSDVRKELGNKLRKYACSDAKGLIMTKSLHNQSWSYKDVIRKKTINHHVEVLFESDHNSMYMFQDFVTDPDCRALESASSSTPDEDSRDRIALVPQSAKRNTRIGALLKKIEDAVASSAFVKVSHNESDPILRLYKQSATTGSDEQCEMDQDGTCVKGGNDNTSPVLQDPLSLQLDESVVARVMIFCGIPEQGGTVMFTNAGVFIDPKKVSNGALVIITEKEKEREKDPFVNEYTICPVKEGSYFIAVDDATPVNTSE